MKSVQSLFAALSILPVLITIPAYAGVTISNPANGAEVASTFNLSANAVSCSSQSISAMGYSFDHSTDTTVIKGGSIDVSVSAPSGSHTLHVKAWGHNGSACVTDVAIQVASGGSSASNYASIPSYASTVSNIEVMADWQMAHDTGGPGSSSGSMSIVTSPSLSGTARRFVSEYSSGGDERYSITYSDDSEAQNFFYDGWIYLTSSASNIANIEMDTNQTMANGETAMFGVQCDGYSGNWAYTVNKGSASSPRPTWVSKSGTSCNARNWKINTWHHVQASYSRDNSGWLTYHSVWLDGVETQLNETVFGAFDLGWGPSINTQFQVDGLGSTGHTTVYLDSLTISRW